MNTEAHTETAATMHAAWEQRMAAMAADGAARREAQRAALQAHHEGHTRETRPDGVTVYTPKPGYVTPVQESIIQRH